MNNRWIAPCTLIASLWLARSTAALAADVEQDTGALRPTTPSSSASLRLADEGALLAWTEPARTGSERASATMHGGRTGLGGTVMGAARLTLLDTAGASEPRSGTDLGLALRAGASTRPREDVKLDLGVQAQFLFQEDAGVDLALALDYQNEGFNLRPEVVATLLLARKLGPVSLLANAAYGHGVRDDERFGQLRLAALLPATPSLRVGVDSSLALDLELDSDEPPGEPELELQGGPAATLVLGVIGLGAQVGVAVSKLRFEATRIGPAALVGAGAAF